MAVNVKVVGKNKSGEEVVCFVRRPNSKDYRDAKVYANSVVSTIVKDNFLVRSQMSEIRKRSGVWNDTHAKKLVDITKEIDSLELKLMKGGIKKSEGKAICFEIEDLRSEQLNLISRMNSLDEQTVEAIAENTEFDYLVSCCSLDESGERIFQSVDDYKERAGDEPYFFSLAKELQNIIYGYTAIEESIKDRPEYKFLLKFGFMNDNMELVDKEGNLVNREGKRVDKEGYLVNENNERVDRDGNKLDEKGNRIIEFDNYIED